MLQSYKIIGFYDGDSANFPEVGKIRSESILLVLEGIENKFFKVGFLVSPFSAFVHYIFQDIGPKERLSIASS